MQITHAQIGDVGLDRTRTTTQTNHQGPRPSTIDGQPNHQQANGRVQTSGTTKTTALRRCTALNVESF